MSKLLALSSAAILASAAFISSPAAFAIVLTPGASGPPDALSVSGATLATTSGSFASDIDGGCADFCGTYEATVVANTLNPFGAGDLAFIVWASSSASSGHIIDTLSTSSFGSSAGTWMTDAGYETPTNGGVIPAVVDRGSVDGSAVNFKSLGLGPGGMTDFLVVDTNAKAFRPGDVSFIDDGVATVSAFEPSAVPEPPTWAMLGLGFAAVGLLGFARRRRNSRFGF